MAAVSPAGAIKAAKFCAYLNGAYHADRESYLDGWHRALMFLVIMLGASVVVEALPDYARAAAGISTAAIAALDLVLNLSVRARTAAFLRKSYFEIAADLEEGNITAVQADARMLRLSAEEEPPYMAAHALAENWATGAVYGSEKARPCRVNWWKRMTRNLLHYAGHNFSGES